MPANDARRRPQGGATVEPVGRQALGNSGWSMVSLRNGKQDVPRRRAGTTRAWPWGARRISRASRAREKRALHP